MATDEFEKGREYEKRKRDLGAVASEVIAVTSGLGTELFNKYSPDQIESRYKILTSGRQKLQTLTKTYYPSGNALVKATLDTASQAISALESLMPKEEENVLTVESPQ